MKPLYVLLVGIVGGWAASGVDWSREAVAQEEDVHTFSDHPPALQSPILAPPAPSLSPGLVGRFQATAYGSPNGHGCYVVDSTTGQTWLIRNGQRPEEVAKTFLAEASGSPQPVNPPTTYPYDPTRTTPPDLPTDK